MLIRKGHARWLMYIITDATTGGRKTGLTYTDITVKYKKEGQFTETEKILTGNDFREIGNGKYEIFFTGDELDTVGVFHTEITGTGIEPATREDYIIDFVRGVPTIWENLV